MNLPIDDVLPEVLSHLASHNLLVLQSPPGSGKTTRVPMALLEADWRGDRRILLVQPRRVAARSVAEFMAAVRHETAGETVGYRTREDTRVGAATRVEVVTDGVLVRLLQADPALDDYACVILDEFHERSVLSDLAFAMLQDVRQAFRDDLRIILMSATLGDLEQHALLADYRRLSSAGRTFPVSVTYLPPRQRQPWLEHLVQVTAQQMHTFPQESLLVFLPGKPELKRALAQLQERFPDENLLPLHGDLSLKEQAAVIADTRATRKIVLATAIAETSLTLEGINRVIDSGYGRYSRHDPGSGMTRLVTQRISEASAQQRAGRAGRLAPGVCIRLWPESERLASHNTPPLLQADMLPVVLAAARWGARARTDLQWLDAPHAGFWMQAEQLLRQWQALDAQGKPTALGVRLSETPSEPRLAFMIEQCRLADRPQLAAILAVASALSTRPETPAGDADFVAALQAALRARHSAFGREWRRLLQQFSLPDEMPLLDEYRLAIHVAKAFPDRLARVRQAGAGRYLLASGKGAVLDAADSLQGSEWLLVLAMQAERADGRIYSAMRLRADDVDAHFASLMETRDSLRWDARQERFVASRVRTLGSIVLDETPMTAISVESKQQAMAELVRREGLALFHWREEAQSLCHALRAAAEAGVLDNSWPDFSEAGLVADCENWLIPFCQTVTRKADFEQINLHALLLARLNHAQQQWLQNHLPTLFCVPTGRQVTIHYTAEKNAWFEVKLQEMFGVQRLPHLGNGCIPLQARLLSPAGRPVAITQDIAYFWRSVYPAVRKELRGRYPKHPWPEDPLAAIPQAGVKHPRKTQE